MSLFADAAENMRHERLRVACILSMVGGFLDIYTYLFHGGVFANAVTGNIVFLGINLAEMRWENCGKYLLAVIFYALGVFVADAVCKYVSGSRQVVWHQAVLVLEICCLLAVAVIPYGGWDFAVNSTIAFVCAMQVQTFRRVRGAAFASTMCTGNLRSGTGALFNYFQQKDRAELKHALHYYLVITFFIFGVVIGVFWLRWLGHWGLLLAPAGLLAVFVMISGGNGGRAGREKVL